MKGSTRARLIKLLKELEARKATKAKPRVRPALIKKQQLVNEIKELLRKYKVMGIIDLFRTPTPQYKKIKFELEKYGFVKVYKNVLIKRAMEELGLPGVKELEPYLTGTNAFIFTNLNPFELSIMLDKLVEMKYAKPGDVATDDIYVPQGPTGIPPGPMLSIFGKLRIPTQVREGVIWIAKDTRVAKAGDTISPELASLLRKLDIKVIAVKLRLKAVWDSGLVIPAEKLKVDIESFRNELLSAVRAAREVAIEAAVPLPDVMPEVITRAVKRALALASEAGFVTPETAEYVIRSAVSKALALAAAIAPKAPELELKIEVAPAAAPQPKEERKEEEEEEEKKEEVSEEEIAEGIASLFG